MSIAPPILPGATIGVFGSGQLGRMMALAARAMGYRIATFSPDNDSPTGQVADREIIAAYADEDAVRAFVSAVQVVTFEFENVRRAVAEIAEEVGVPVRPGGCVLHTAQQRAREKRFLADTGLPVPAFAIVTSEAELTAALHSLGCPAILKTAAFGYDGKGQARIQQPQDAGARMASLWRRRPVLEAFVDFQAELSVVAARGIDGSFAHYGAIENQHAHHILDISIAPARLPAHVAAEAVELTRVVHEKLAVVGVLCVEFFWANDGRLLINEVAPRPHNSGHLTIEAAIDQPVRATATRGVRAAARLNRDCATRGHGKLTRRPLG